MAQNWEHSVSNSTQTRKHTPIPPPWTLLVLWLVMLPPASVLCQPLPVSCDLKGVKTEDGQGILQSGPRCRMLRDKRGQRRRPFVDRNELISHLRLGQLQGHRLEFDHIGVAARAHRVSQVPKKSYRDEGVDSGAVKSCPSVERTRRMCFFAAPRSQETRIGKGATTHLWQAKIPHILGVRSGSSRA